MKHVTTEQFSSNERKIVYNLNQMENAEPEEKCRSVMRLPGAHVFRARSGMHFRLLSNVESLKLALGPGVTWTHRYCVAGQSPAVSVRVTNTCNVIVSPAASATWRSVSGDTTTGMAALLKGEISSS